MAAKKSVVRQEPTALTFNALQTAFDFFNAELFGGKLPSCMILLHRKKGAHGYYWPERFGDRKGKIKLDEIALSPSSMRERDDRTTLSTLVHEMCHLQQKHFGKPAKGAYHNQEWGTMMLAVGLQPVNATDSSKPPVGTKVTHTIIKAGVFDKACARLLKTGLSLPYAERPDGAKTERAARQRASKTKFCCPSCDAAAWGKPTLSIICGECDEPMEAE